MSVRSAPPPSPRSQRAPSEAAPATARVKNSKSAVLDYVDRSDAKRQRGDIDQILLRHISENSPLERGIVGPTGASSVVNPGVLGPLFAAWGLVAGYRIINRAHDARAYLRLVTSEIDKVSVELENLKSAADDARAPKTIEGLESRRKVLANFRNGVRQAIVEQRFNQTVPGFIQFGASVGIMAVGINSIPTLGNGGTLLNATGSLALGVASGGALCVYGGLSLGRSLYMAMHAWRRPKRDTLVAGSSRERRYLQAYNERVGLHRLFHTLNSVSWAGFVGGCGCMMGIAAGAALSHGAVIAAVVLAALAVVVWDKLWGERCAPRNAMTPHIDRNHLQTMGERAEVWHLLQNLGVAKEQLQQDLLAALPATANGPNLRRRYERIWRFVPMLGGTQKLAAWTASRPTDAGDVALLNYLTTYMQGEQRFLSAKLRRHKIAARGREQELARAGGVPASLAPCMDYDRAITAELRARLKATRALGGELHGVQQDVRRRQRGPDAQRVGRLLASFIAVNGLENEVFSGRDVERDPLSFDAPMRPAGRFTKARPAHIALNARGLSAIENAGLTRKQRGRLLHALMSDRQRQYELDALFNLEADQAPSIG